MPAMETSLNSLDEQVADLSSGQRSRETMNAKSRLAAMRKQWEALKQKSKLEGEVVSGQVDKWHQFQHALSSVESWMERAERYLDEPAGKGLSLADVKQQQTKHASVQKEKDEQQKDLERLVRDSRQLGKSPEITAALLNTETRWDNVCEALDARGGVLKKAADAWTMYENTAGQVDNMLSQQEKAIADLPTTTFVETSVLEAQVRTTKV